LRGLETLRLPQPSTIRAYQQENQVDSTSFAADAPSTPMPEPGRLPQLHDVQTARRRIGVGLTKFYELINNGQIRTVKIGSRRLVSEDAIGDYIASLESEATPQAHVTEEAA
jgi:excisionase family DNA binding protein